MNGFLKFEGIGEVVFPVERQFHVLGHFMQIDKEYRQRLYGSGYTDSAIDKQFEKIGSKFNVGFIENPLKLFNWICKYNRDTGLITRWSEGKCEVSFFVNREEFPDGAGTDNLIHLSELNHDEQKRIQMMQRDSFNVKTIVKQSQSTWQLNLILEKRDADFSVKALFPGIYAPPFPDRQTQSLDQHNQSMSFWMHHAFLINA